MQVFLEHTIHLLTQRRASLDRSKSSDFLCTVTVPGARRLDGLPHGSLSETMKVPSAEVYTYNPSDVGGRGRRFASSRLASSASETLSQNEKQNKTKPH